MNKLNPGDKLEKIDNEYKGLPDEISIFNSIKCEPDGVEIPTRMARNLCFKGCDKHLYSIVEDPDFTDGTVEDCVWCGILHLHFRKLSKRNFEF